MPLFLLIWANHLTENRVKMGVISLVFFHILQRNIHFTRFIAHSFSDKFRCAFLGICYRYWEIQNQGQCSSQRAAYWRWIPQISGERKSREVGQRGCSTRQMAWPQNWCGLNHYLFDQWWIKVHDRHHHFCWWSSVFNKA